MIPLDTLDTKNGEADSEAGENLQSEIVNPKDIEADIESEKEESKTRKPAMPSLPLEKIQSILDANQSPGR